MKKIIFLLLLSVLFLTACVEYGVTIQVNRDGSGEIKENILMSKQIINVIKSMDSEGGTDFLCQEDEQKSKSIKFGKGVTFDRITEVSTETKAGYTTIYTFEDINQVIISNTNYSQTIDSLNENMDMLGEEVDLNDDTDSDDEEVAEKYFSFKYNKPGKLTINNGFSENLEQAKKALEDERDQEEEELELSDEAIDQQLSLASVFTQGLKIYAKVQFNSIKEANVPYENNEIVLFEIDMDKMLDDKEAFKELMKGGEKDIAKILNKEKSFNGITFQNSDKINIEFK